MLKSLDALEDEFRGIVEKSKEECKDELEKLRKLILALHKNVFKSLEECFIDEKKKLSPQYQNSLAFTRLLELMLRTAPNILFLCCNGLHRDAFNDLRYILESIVQALYIDLRHPKSDIKTKIEILREVEDKTEYRASRLIKHLQIDYKDKLRGEYKRLSRIIHPSHEQILSIRKVIITSKGIPTSINCREILKIYNSTRIMYDIFVFLFITYFPEFKDSLKKNSDFIKHIKIYKLTLLSKVFKV